jgi:hypothetical protein
MTAKDRGTMQIRAAADPQGKEDVEGRIRPLVFSRRLWPISTISLSTRSKSRRAIPKVAELW